MENLRHPVIIKIFSSCLLPGIFHVNKCTYHFYAWIAKLIQTVAVQQHWRACRAFSTNIEYCIRWYRIHMCIRIRIHLLSHSYCVDAIWSPQIPNCNFHIAHNRNAVSSREFAILASYAHVPHNGANCISYSIYPLLYINTNNVFYDAIYICAHETSAKLHCKNIDASSFYISEPVLYMIYL